MDSDVLRDKKLEQLQKAPIIETKMTLSGDGKWFVHKTIITDIKPVAYVEKVMR